MKKLIFTLFLVVTATGLSVQAHVYDGDYLGLPGDNLNLFAVLKLFQESQTLESFERDLNDERTHINNLDLDEDGRIDYIRVVDHADGNYHTIVMQDALGPHEVQDVAVFTVFRDKSGRVNIQLTGDEALYGKDYIIEPNYSDVNHGETPNPGYSDYSYVDGERVYVTHTTTVEVAAWPLVRFIYMPSYSVWVSPWYYNYYPTYWHPWHPYYWHYYYGYHYNWDNYYYSHYRVWNHHHDNYWHDNYYSRRRSYSPVVYDRVKSGSYDRTYSHPEMRHEGYNTFYKDHPSQQPRRSANDIKDPVAEHRSQGSQQHRGATTYDHRTSENPHTRQGNGTYTNGSSSGRSSSGSYSGRSSSGSGSSNGSGRRSTETKSTHSGTSTPVNHSQTNRTPSTSNPQPSTPTPAHTNRESSGSGSSKATTTTHTNTQRSSGSSTSNRSASGHTESHPATEQKKASTTSDGGSEHQGTRRSR